MQFNVSSFLRAPTGAVREYEIDDDVKIDDAPAAARHRLRGRARMDRTTDGILVRAEMRSHLDAECSRCLRAVKVPVVLEFEEEYLPIVDVTTGARVQIPEGREDAYRINELHILDLEVAARQYWTMTEPMAPLCREDCPGLCPVCGEDMSKTGHACTADEIDARWSKLAELRSSRP